MRQAFMVLAGVLMVAVVAQFFFAATGAFDTAPNDESFQIHRALGYGILLFAILTTIVAAVARMPRHLVAQTGLVAGLVVVQTLIRAIAGAFGDTGDSSMIGQLVFGLHAVNALAIMATTVEIFREARAQPAPVERSP